MPIFVIQHHLATADHYDFRLEVDGVLASWAVPRGPSLDPAVKRLAVHVDDHEMEHAGFEGPTGRPGKAVLVWDRGTYRNTTNRNGIPVPMAGAITSGHLSFELDGTKLHGGFALTRTGTGRQWLLVKKRDGAAEPGYDPLAEEPASVLTGRTMEEIAGG